MKKFCIIIFVLVLINTCAYSKTQKEEYKNDYLYSAEYFDYLIECAQQDKQKELEEQKANNEEEIVSFDFDEEIEILDSDFPPFHLRIEQNANVLPYKDTFVKQDTKTIIPISNKFAFIQNTVKSRNKYNSHDYKILAGGEYRPFKFLTLASGLETNYRGLDQNPSSRKLYLSPTLYLGDKVSLGFYNKLNILNYSTDHDIGINVSPFKSKIIDFGVYSGLTRKKDGAVTESISFSTNFYF